MSDQVEDFLEHYGVRGMKWGVRKDRSAASKLSTNAKTNGKDAYPGLSTKNSGHAGDKLSSTKASKPKSNKLRTKALDTITAGFASRHQAHVAKRQLKRLERAKPDTSTRRGRRKQKKVDQAKLDAAFAYALAKPRKKIYVTKDGVEKTVKGKKFAKQVMSRRRVRYEDIRVRPTPQP